MATTNKGRCLQRRLKLKESGLCQRCAVQKTDNGYQYCSTCRINNKTRMNKLRDEVFEAYGGYICACCGETNRMFLTLDHINNDGASHRKTGKRTRDLRLLLKKNNYPPGFRVLCFNCNVGRYINGGICPHQTNKNFMPFTFIA